MTWLLWSGLIVCLLVAAALGIAAFGGKRWTDATLTLIRGLEAARIDGAAIHHARPATTRASWKACLLQCDATSARY